MIVHDVNCHARWSFARHVECVIGDRAVVIRCRAEMRPSRSTPLCQSIQHQQPPTGRATDYHSGPEVDSQRVVIVRIADVVMDQPLIRYRTEQVPFRAEDKNPVALQYDNVAGMWRTAVHYVMKSRGLGVGLARSNGANTAHKRRCCRRLSTRFGERPLELEHVRLNFVYQQSTSSITSGKTASL
jgi:hypothetical protein